MNIKTADRLQALRKNNGLSQDALAEKLGVSRQSISKWERGEASPDTDNLIALASLYGITLDELINGEKLPKNTLQIEESVKETEEEIEDKKTGIYAEKGNKLLKFPFPFLVIIAYLVLGFLCNLWHPGWLIFLTIPAYYQYAGACFTKTKKGYLLALPVVEAAVIIYLLLGFLPGLWHPMWIIFLAIPVYYWVVGMKKEQ